MEDVFRYIKYKYPVPKILSPNDYFVNLLSQVLPFLKDSKGSNNNSQHSNSSREPRRFPTQMEPMGIQ